MKKPLIFVCCILISLFILTTLSACDKTQKEEEEVCEISYIQEELYTGESANFMVTVASGKSENMFIANGTAGDLVDFATLTVTPLHVDLFNCDYQYKLIGENGELCGEMKKDTFGTSFIAELKDYKTVGKLTCVKIIRIDAEEEIALTDRLLDKINSEEALKIAKENLADKIAEEKDAGIYKREIYVKYINDEKNAKSDYFWYVAYIASPTDYWALLIDPVSGKVIVKK